MIAVTNIKHRMPVTYTYRYVYYKFIIGPCDDIYRRNIKNDQQEIGLQITSCKIYPHSVAIRELP